MAVLGRGFVGGGVLRVGLDLVTVRFCGLMLHWCSRTSCRLLPGGRVLFVSVAFLCVISGLRVCCGHACFLISGAGGGHPWLD